MNSILAKPFRVNSFRLTALLLALAALVASALPAGAAGATPSSVMFSGFYDHQIIEYESAAGATSSPQAAQQLSLGNVVYHIVDASGNTPAVQCAPLAAALPNDHSDCNVLNFIPTEVGYAGGAWNLQIFHWNAGVTPTLLSKDDDILAAAAAGKGTLEVTNILVRCPVINFASLR